MQIQNQRIFWQDIDLMCSIIMLIFLTQPDPMNLAFRYFRFIFIICDNKITIFILLSFSYIYLFNKTKGNHIKNKT